MAPKRRRDAVAREIAKTYTFGQSQIDKTDVEALVKNRMVGAGRAPGCETVSRPRDNEVVIFRDLLYAGLRFPLHPAVVDILRYFYIYLHQLTPNDSPVVGIHVDMPDNEDQALRRRVRFGASSASPAADGLRGGGGPIRGEGLSVRLSQLLV
jgi:hypothetical protein